MGILENFSEYFTQSNFLLNGIRTLGWWTIKFLATICRLAEDLFNEAFKWLDFGSSEVIEKIVSSNNLKLIVISIMTLSLICIGYLMMIDKRKVDIISLPSNILMPIFVMMCLPFFIMTANSMLTSVKDSLDIGNSKLTDSIITEHLFDLRYMDLNGYNTSWLNDDGEMKVPANYIYGKTNQKNMLNSLNINTVMTDENIEGLNQQIYDQVLSYDENGVSSLKKMKSGKASILGATLWDTTAYYYRYSFNWFAIILTLLAVGIGMFFSSAKVSRLGFEIVYQRIFAILFAAGNLNGQQKTKNILLGIMNTYLVLVYVCLSVKGMYIALTWSNATFPTMIHAIFSIFIAICVIDGPVWVERVLGIDAGLEKGTVTTFYHTMKATGSIGSALKNAFGSALAMPGRVKDFAQDRIENNGGYRNKMGGIFDGFKNEYLKGQEDPDANISYDERNLEDPDPNISYDERSLEDPNENIGYDERNLEEPDENISHDDRSLEDQGSNINYDSRSLEDSNLDTENGNTDKNRNTDDPNLKGFDLNSNDYNGILNDDQKISLDHGNGMDLETRSTDSNSLEQENDTIKSPNGNITQQSYLNNDELLTGQEESDSISKNQSQDVDIPTTQENANMLNHSNINDVSASDKAQENSNVSNGNEVKGAVKNGDEVSKPTSSTSNTAQPKENKTKLDEKSQPGLAPETLEQENREQVSEDSNYSKMKKSRLAKDIEDQRLQRERKAEKMRQRRIKDGVDLKGQPTFDSPFEKREQLNQSKRIEGEKLGQQLARFIKKFKK